MNPARVGAAPAPDPAGRDPAPGAGRGRGGPAAVPPPVLAAAARASLEQIELARAAAEIERWLRREDRQAIDVERLLAFVAQVRLRTALAGGELTEILLRDPAIQQTDGA